DLTFPSMSIPVSADGQARALQSPPVKFSVTNPVTDPAQSELKDIKGPMTAPLPYWFWLVIAGILAALAAGVWFYYRQNPPEEKLAPPEPPRPPKEVALEKLAALWAAYQQNADHKIFCSELSNIFREYLSRQFNVDALEKTTQEIFAEMRARSI